MEDLDGFREVAFALVDRRQKTANVDGQLERCDLLEQLHRLKQQVEETVGIDQLALLELHVERGLADAAVLLVERAQTRCHTVHRRDKDTSSKFQFVEGLEKVPNDQTLMEITHGRLEPVFVADVELGKRLEPRDLERSRVLVVLGHLKVQLSCCLWISNARLDLLTRVEHSI